MDRERRLPHLIAYFNYLKSFFSTILIQRAWKKSNDRNHSSCMCASEAKGKIFMHIDEGSPLSEANPFFTLPWVGRQICIHRRWAGGKKSCSKTARRRRWNDKFWSVFSLCRAAIFRQERADICAFIATHSRFTCLINSPRNLFLLILSIFNRYQRKIYFSRALYDPPRRRRSWSIACC